MNDILEAVRAKYPAYKDVPDDDLTRAIGEKYPAYLERSAAFKSDFERVTKPALRPVMGDLRVAERDMQPAAQMQPTMGDLKLAESTMPEPPAPRTTEQLLDTMDTSAVQPIPRVTIPDRSAQPAVAKTPGTMEGLWNSLRAGVKRMQAIPETLMLALTADDAKPTIQKEYMAYRRAMEDPRFSQALLDAGQDTMQQRQAAALFGPEAKLGQMMEIPRQTQRALAGDVAESERQIASIPRSAPMQRLSEARSSGEKWKVWASDPVEITASIALESLPPSIAGALVGSVGGPAGVAVGAGTSSGLLTFSSELLGNSGVDVRDEQALLEWVNSDRFDQDFQKAAAKSAVIGQIDGLTAGAAGQFVKPAIKEGFKKLATSAAKEIGLQAAGGAGGEALGSVVAGQPIDSFDVAMEAFAEVATAPGEVASNLWEGRKKDTGQRLETPIAPDPVVTIAEANNLPATAQALKEVTGNGQGQEKGNAQGVSLTPTGAGEQPAPVPTTEVLPKPAESVVAATVQPFKGGEVFEGQTHALAYNQMREKYPDIAPESVIAGWKTSDGRIVDRKEAGNIAGQKKALESEDIQLPNAPTPNTPKVSAPVESTGTLAAKTGDADRGTGVAAPAVGVEKGAAPAATKAEAPKPEPPATEPPGDEGTAGARSGSRLLPSGVVTHSLTPKSQREIIKDLAKGLGVPIRFGRLTTNKFAGYFKKVQNLIGSKKANDVPIVSHEVGHKLDAAFDLSRDPVIRAELESLGDPALPGSLSSWTPSKSMKYKRGEGMAEFVRYWLTDPAEAARLAPFTEAAFKAALDANKDIGDVLRQAREDIQLWRNAEPQARLRSHISVGSNPNKTRYSLSQLTRDLVDDLHMLKMAVNDLRRGGTTVNPSDDFYLLARNLRGSYGMADSFIRHGVADFATREVTLGTSLEDALKPVAGRINDFRDWIIAKRAQELHAQGRETGLVDSDVQAVAQRFDGDAAFQESFAKIKAWQDALLQYAVDAGFVTEEGAAKMRAMNQDYVPLHRVFEVGAGEPSSSEGTGTGRGLNVGKPGSLKKLTGSQRDIVDPLETMVRNAYSIITAAEKHAINLAVANAANKPEMGQWVERVVTPKELERVGLEKVRDQLEAAGADLTAVPEDLLLTFYQNARNAPFGENIIKVNRNGKAEFYRLKRELFDTFHALDLEDSGILIRMMSAPAQLLRSGVTLDVAFSLANAMRDAFTSAIVSRHGLLPFEAVFRGVRALLTKPELVAAWEAAGGKNSIEASYFDREKLQRFLSEKITKDLTPAERALIVTKSPLQALRWLTSFAEEATRIGEFEKAFNDLTGSGMPEGEARRLAAFESRDRQDFAKGGAKTKIVRRLAAFWNAGLQGNIRLAQAFKEQPIKTTLKGLAFITIPKMIEQALNWDDDDYWDRPQWERDLFFLIPAGKGKDGHTRFIRIPTPFEAGVIFGTLPGRVMQAIHDQEAKALKGAPVVLLKNAIPNPTPQFAMTMLEDFAIGKQGWDVYRQRPIVPDSLAQLPPEMQWTEQTSLTARKMGEALGFPPMKIDHIINSTTGGLGKQVTHQIVDRALALATGEKTAENAVVPGGRFLTTPAAVSSESIDQFYKTLDEIKTAAAGKKKGGPESELTGWMDRFTRAERQMSDWRKRMRRAESEAEKNELAERILEKARSLMQEYRERQ